MKLTEFNKLDQIEKAKTLQNFGELIEERLERENQVLVYRMNNFFAEVYYEKGYQIIKQLRSFTNKNLLSPYFDKVDISNFKFN